MSVGRAARWYIAAGLSAVLVLVAGWFLLVAPQRATAEETQLTAESKEAVNLQTEQQIASLKAQYKDLPDIEKQTAAIRSKLPQSPSMPSLIRQLSSLAKTSGVALVAVAPQTPVPLTDAGAAAVAGQSSLATPGQVNQIPVTIKVVGRFANVRLFLSGVERLDRAVLLTGVTIKRSETAEDSASTGALEVDLSGRTFMANKGVAPKPAAATTTTDGSTGAAPDGSSAS
ncbi:MAG: type 4a pilus biogenesis protein PilO [Candidatus Nanopelagicales bacterium]